MPKYTEEVGCFVIIIVIAALIYVFQDVIFGTNFH